MQTRRVPAPSPRAPPSKRSLGNVDATLSNAAAEMHIRDPGPPVKTSVDGSPHKRFDARRSPAHRALANLTKDLVRGPHGLAGGPAGGGGGGLGDA
eukprot:CAMPEP_0172643872 /NCGR_PEP_ID=MMETSP1068-20121228/238753_1 /TAXON_ID=35684 /ORGANISM="Pseudopedinella elastica, Strain CCMP716" /LENGTH=95 /DNA_ID=CAMNT_0013458029 /DNA_START=44 /DNA_END=327 /DNA_ORIENTATION=+